MLIKNDKVRYLNLDMTYCVSTKCPLKPNCDRNYMTLIGDGVVFSRQVSMVDFYHQNAVCEDFIDGGRNE